MRKFVVLITLVIQVSVSAQTINDIIAETFFQYNPAWLARQIAYPVNNGKMDGYEDALPFQTYSNWIGARHVGSDISRIDDGDGNGDLGDTIFCIGRGKVIYVFNDIVMILHKTVKGYIVSQYRHCLETFVLPGQYIEYLQPIARIGNCDGAYLAHLHFEIRTDILMDVRGGYGDPSGYVDPMKFIENFNLNNY